MVGLPRAIAYDAETLRLFAQVGLFDAIAPGLIQDPEVLYFNARGRRLMHMKPPKTVFGHSPTRYLLSAALRKGVARWLERFACVRASFAPYGDGVWRRIADGVDVRIETPRGQRVLRAKFVVGCDGGAPARRAKRLARG